MVGSNQLSVRNFIKGKVQFAVEDNVFRTYNPCKIMLL